MSDDLVTITNYAHQYEADLAKLYLDQEGIESFLANGAIVRMDWLLANAVGGIRLMVRSGDAERAKALLAERNPKFDMAGESRPMPGFEDLTCLECGEAMTEENAKCPKCGWSYEDSEEGR